MFMPGHFKNGQEGLNNIRSSFLPYLLKSGTKEHKKHVKAIVKQSHL